MLGSRLNDCRVAYLVLACIHVAAIDLCVHSLSIQRCSANAIVSNTHGWLDTPVSPFCLLVYRGFSLDSCSATSLINTPSQKSPHQLETLPSDLLSLAFLLDLRLHCLLLILGSHRLRLSSLLGTTALLRAAVSVTVVGLGAFFLALALARSRVLLGCSLEQKSVSASTVLMEWQLTLGVSPSAGMGCPALSASSSALSVFLRRPTIRSQAIAVRPTGSGAVWCSVSEASSARRREG